MADRVTQQVLQVAYQPTPTARATTLALEVMQTPPAPSARVSTIALEVLQTVTATTAGSNTSIMYVIAG